MKRALAILALLFVGAIWLFVRWLGPDVVLAVLLGGSGGVMAGLFAGFLAGCWAEVTVPAKKSARATEVPTVPVATASLARRPEPGSPADLLDAALVAAMAVPPLMRPTFVMRIIERWEIGINSEGRVVMPRHVVGRGN